MNKPTNGVYIFISFIIAGLISEFIANDELFVRYAVSIFGFVILYQYINTLIKSRGKLNWHFFELDRASLILLGCFFLWMIIDDVNSTSSFFSMVLIASLIYRLGSKLFTKNNNVS